MPAPIDPLLDESATHRRALRRGRIEFRRNVVAALVFPVICCVVGVDRWTSSGDPRLGSRSDATPVVVGVAQGTTVAIADIGDVPDHRDDPMPTQVASIIVGYESSGNRWPDRACRWIEPLLEDHRLPDWMLAVAWRESRCRADVHNGDRSTGDDSWGLFQINTLGPTLRAELARTCGIVDERLLLDPEHNVDCSARLYRRYGFRPWHAGVYFG